MVKKRYSFIYIALLALTACSSGNEDVHTFVNQVKTTSKGKVNALPPIKDSVNQEYTAMGLRSPFMAAKSTDRIGKLNDSEGGGSDATVEIVQEPRPDASRKRQFLERFSLDDFVMVGSISKENYIWALVQNSDGLVFPVKVGDYIGQNSGYIVGITPEKVTIEETVVDGIGGWKREINQLVIKTASVNEGRKR